MSFGRFDESVESVTPVGQTEVDASELKKVTNGNENPKYGSFDSTETFFTKTQESERRDSVGQSPFLRLIWFLFKHRFIHKY